jgi:hypothetical protein
MPKYDVDLNFDQDDVKTPARWDDVNKRWVMDMSLIGSNIPNIELLQKDITTRSIPAGSIYTPSPIDVSKYKSISAIVEFDSSPGTVLVFRVQEIASSGSGNVFYDTNTNNQGKVNANSIYQLKSDIGLGDTARIVVANNDTVARNLKAHAIRGHRH